MFSHRYLNRKRIFFLVLSLGVVISCIVTLFKRHQLEAAFNQQIEQSDDLWNINYNKSHYFTLLNHHTIICLVHGLTCLLDIVPTYFLLKFALTITLYLVLFIDCILLPRYQSGFVIHYLHPYFTLQDYFAASQHLFIGQFFLAVLIMLLMLHSRAFYHQLIERLMTGKDGLVLKNRYSKPSVRFNGEKEEVEEEVEEEEEEEETEEVIKEKTEKEDQKTDEIKEDSKVVKEVIAKAEVKEVKKPDMKVITEAAVF